MYTNKGHPGYYM